MRTTKMWPTVIELHDEYFERTQGRMRVVARVYTDGARGRLDVLAPEYRRSLTALFTRQRAQITGSATAPDGVHSVFADRVLLPWKRETIAHLITHELMEKSLKAVFVRGQP